MGGILAATLVCGVSNVDAIGTAVEPERPILFPLLLHNLECLK